MRLTTIWMASGALAMVLACGGAGTTLETSSAQVPVRGSGETEPKVNRADGSTRTTDLEAWYEVPTPTPRTDDYAYGQVDPVELHGWTADGSRVIVRSVLRAMWTGDFDGYKEDTYHVVQFVGPDGSRERAFPGSWSEPAARLLEPDLSTEDAVRPLQAARPRIERSDRGRLSVAWDGKVEAWPDGGVDQRISSTAEPSVFRIRLDHGGVERVVVERAIEGNYAGASTFTAQASWHPDRPLLALLIGEVHNPHQLSGVRDEREILFVRLDPVDVQVVTSSTTPVDLLAELPAGFRASSRSPARKDRTEAVIYAKPGYEASARELARAVPGEVSIEPLTWQAEGGAPLVLALAM